MADDFLGAFGVLERQGRFLLVGNDRVIGGQPTRTWDLPGGRVEPGELVGEALARELREETGLTLAGEPRFLFVQEGERTRRGAREYAWRSFFFAIDALPGEPQPGHEVVAVRWLARAELTRELTAPYHDSFLAWIGAGGAWFRGAWRD
jgi:8-oxo-dGTP diphosphatase